MERWGMKSSPGNTHSKHIRLIKATGGTVLGFRHRSSRQLESPQSTAHVTSSPNPPSRLETLLNRDFRRKDLSESGVDCDYEAHSRAPHQDSFRTDEKWFGRIVKNCEDKVAFARKSRFLFFFFFAVKNLFAQWCGARETLRRGKMWSNRKSFPCSADSSFPRLATSLFFLYYQKNAKAH